MTVWTPIGNVSKFSCTPKLDVKEHSSSMGGTKELDKIAVTTKGAEFELTLDEWTLDNAKMALLGLAGSDTEGTFISILGASSVERQLKFEGTNDFGPRVEIILPHVFMLCKNALELIGEDWNTMVLSGNILRANPPTGIFGTFRYLDTATGSAPLTAPNTLNYMIGKGLVSTAPLA